MDQVEEIKRKADIVEIISEHVTLKKAGRNFKGLCPFHSEKTPSFNVSPELQIYKCFGCGFGGDVYKFLMEFEKIDFPQALKLLADRTGVKLKPITGFAGHQEKEEIYAVNFVTAEFYHFLLNRHKIGEKARLYLKSRGVTDEAIETFKLGYAPDKLDATFNFLTQKRGYKPELLEKAGIVGSKDGRYYDRFRGRIVFPLLDHFGNVLGFSGRVLEDHGDLAKYINSPETLVYKKAQTLCGLNITKNDIKKEGCVVVVEGEFDLISSWVVGVRNVVAIKGSAVTNEQAQLLNRFTQKVVLGLDSDFAGDQASRRGLEVLQSLGIEVRVVALGKKDPDEAARSNPDMYKQTIKDAEGVYDFLINSALRRYDARTVEGKAKISRELAPVLSAIEDEIVKAHCVKRLAEELQVSEEAVAAQVSKSSKPRQSVLDKEVRAKRSRIDVLEEALLAHLFGAKPELLHRDEYVKAVSTPIRRKLVDEYRRLYAGKEFNSQDFLASLSPELKETYATLAMYDLDLDKGQEVSQNIAALVREIEILQVREKIRATREQIRSFERTGDTAKLSELELILTEETRHLASLEQIAS